MALTYARKRTRRASIELLDFTKGRYEAIRGLRGPNNSLYKLEDGLPQEDGTLIRRGGAGQEFDLSSLGTYLRGMARFGNRRIYSLDSGVGSTLYVGEETSAPSVAVEAASGSKLWPFRQIARLDNAIFVATAIRRTGLRGDQRYAFDNFKGFAEDANLHGGTAEEGGTWTSTGATGDWKVKDYEPRRETGSDAAEGRQAVLGPSTGGDQRVRLMAKSDQWNFQNAESDPQVKVGLLARYIDASNFLRLYLTGDRFELETRIAGVNSTKAFTPVTPDTDSWYTLELYIFETNVQAVAYNHPAGKNDDERVAEAVLDVAVPELATTLSAGKAGMFDVNTKASTTKREYDDFQVQTLPEIRERSAFIWAGGKAARQQVSMTLTKGSQTIKRVSGSFTANDVGAIIFGGATTHRIETIIDATTATIAEGFDGPSGASVPLSLAPTVYPVWALQAFTAASVAGRLCTARAANPFRMRFSHVGEPFSANPNDVHAFPFPISALMAAGDALVVFGDNTSWAVRGLALPITDATGTVQHSASELFADIGCASPEAVAEWQGIKVWADLKGIYSWDGVSRPRNLLEAGGPGLIKRWKDRWSGWGESDFIWCEVVANFLFVGHNNHAAPTTDEVWGFNLTTGGWFTVSTAKTVGIVPREGQLEAKLMVTNAAKTLNVEDYFDPTSANTADGNAVTPPALLLETRDLVAEGNPVTWLRLQVDGEMLAEGSQAPQMDADYAENEGTTYTDLGLDWTSSPSGLQTIGSARFAKYARTIRFKLAVAGESSLVRIARLKVSYRPRRR